MKHRLLITGGSGFVGKNLKELLADTYYITAPSSKQLNLMDTEKVRAYLRKNNFDYVIHAAADVITRNYTKDPTLVLYNNMRMFVNVARCNTLYKRMIYFGSGAEYDMINYRHKMKEDYFDTHVPKDYYGFSKYLSAKYIEATDNIIDLRLFGCFGPYERWQVRFISQSICKAIFDLDIEIGQNVKFDYLYVKDLAPIVESLLTKKRLKFHHYNICTGSSVDLRSIAETIKKVSGKNIKIKLVKNGMKKEYSGDNKRLRSEVKNLQLTPLPVAIAEMFEWYLRQKKNINKKELMRTL